MYMYHHCTLFEGAKNVLGHSQGHNISLCLNTKDKPRYEVEKHCTQEMQLSLPTNSVCQY